MKSNLLIGLLSLLFLGSLNAGRLAEVVKEGRHSSTSSLLEPSVEQMLDQVQTPSSEKMSREDFLKKQREEIDEDSFDKKKKPGFFDRLSSAHKVAMAVAGLAALTGIAGAMWNLKHHLTGDGIKKLTDGLFASTTDKAMKSINEGLAAKNEDKQKAINDGNDELAKMGVRLQKAERIAEKVEVMMPEVERLLPKINTIADGLTRTTELAGKFLTGVGILDEKVKTNGIYDAEKVSGTFGAFLKALEVPLLGGSPVEKAVVKVNA